MNIEVTQEMFDEVQDKFMFMDLRCIDERIRSVVERFKTLPVLDCIVPRWSCQSHGNEVGDSGYYIIFCTRNNGADILFKVYQELYNEISTRYGLGYLACTSLSVVPLLYNNEYDIHNHIQISTITRGDGTFIDICEELWHRVLDKLEEGTL